MQLLLQCCPLRSDYYGGWKTLLFLTAGSRLNGLKRIFRSSCFHKAFKSVVTTAKTVYLCFGHCFFRAFVLPCSCKCQVESFFHKCCKLLVAVHPGSGTAAFQKVPFHEVTKYKIIPVLLEGNISNHSLLFTQGIYSLSTTLEQSIHCAVLGSFIQHSSNPWFPRVWSTAILKVREWDYSNHGIPDAHLCTLTVVNCKPLQW